MPQRREWLAAEAVDSPEPDRIVPPDSPGRVFLAAAARALRGEDCGDLNHQPAPSRSGGAVAVRRTAAGGVGLPAAQAARLDAERVAGWMVAQYPPRRYPGAVLGSPSGSAVHLATALDMPWLPAVFDLTVRWPRGSVDDPVGALRDGTPVATRILAANPDVALRQVHDPARGTLTGSTLTLAVRWRRLPGAYRRFLTDSLEPGAPVLLVCDARTWPVLDAGHGYGFQIGGAGAGFDPVDFRPGGDTLAELLHASGGDPARWVTPELATLPGYAEHGTEPGFEAALRVWARSTGSTLHRVLVPRPEALSAATADLYRDWLHSAGKSGNRCVVECGRLLDPWQVIRAGLVPYWCENAAIRSVAGAEWWLAGSSPFTSVDVLPEPPGLRSSAVAGLPQWLAVASFGRQRRSLDRLAARCYPVTPVPTRHATRVLRTQPCDFPVPGPLRLGQVLAGLAGSATDAGPLIC